MFLIYITTILLSYISTDISIPKVINFGHKFKLTDKPNKRKIHNTEKVLETFRTKNLPTDLAADSLWKSL